MKNHAAKPKTAASIWAGLNYNQRFELLCNTVQTHPAFWARQAWRNLSPAAQRRVTACLKHAGAL